MLFVTRVELKALRYRLPGCVCRDGLFLFLFFSFCFDSPTYESALPPAPAALTAAAAMHRPCQLSNRQRALFLCLYVVLFLFFFLSFFLSLFSFFLYSFIRFVLLFFLLVGLFVRLFLSTYTLYILVNT